MNKPDVYLARKRVKQGWPEHLAYNVDKGWSLDCYLDPDDEYLIVSPRVQAVLMYILSQTVMDEGQEPVGTQKILEGCGIKNESGEDWGRTAWLALARVKTLGFLYTYRSGPGKFYAVKADEDLGELKAELVERFYFSLLAERVTEPKPKGNV